MKKGTDDLKQELMDAPSLNNFLSDNHGQFNDKNISEALNQLFEKRKISKAALAKQSGMSEIYLHQIFAGRRNPSRSRLICLCYGLDATLDETQELYPKNRRDAILIYGLVHHVSLFEINDKFFAEDEETLF